jgi:hypothetical protein
MCTVLPPPGVNSTAVNKYIIYHIISTNSTEQNPSSAGERNISYSSLNHKVHYHVNKTYHSWYRNFSQDGRVLLPKNNATAQTKASWLECPFIPIFLGQYWFMDLKRCPIVRQNSVPDTE